MQSFFYIYAINLALMIKYTPTSQLTLEVFSHPFENELSPDNRWVKLSKVVPWDELASVYAKQLDSGSGRESIDIRMVIGAIIVKHKLGLDDRGTVEMISENIYLQYFCGLSSFQTGAPFHPTVFVDIRKRMGASSFDKWNELVIEKADQIKPKNKRKIAENNKDQNKGKVVKNKGTLKIDATVANQKIAFPTDAGLLNTARLESERIIDLLYKRSSLTKKPRTYRKIARKEYLNFSKKRQKSKKAIRKFIRKHLEYLKRNIAHIDSLLDIIEAKKQKQNLEGEFSGKFDLHPYRFPLSKRDQKIFWVIISGFLFVFFLVILLVYK